MDPVKAGLALALKALTGAHDRAEVDVEGARQIGQGGQVVPGAVCEAAVAGAEVVEAVGGKRECECEADDAVSVEEEAELVVDGNGLARLETDGLRKTGGGIWPFTVTF